MERLTLSLWPFIIIAPGELLGAFLIQRTNPQERSGLLDYLDVPLAVLAGLLLSAACLAIARRLIQRSRSARSRSVSIAIVIYVVVAVLSGILMALMLVDRGPTGQPAELTALYIFSRPVNIIILAVVVQQVRDGLATTRAVDAISHDQLLLVRQVNEMIEAAEHDLRAESLRVFASQVARPLRRIVGEGPGLSNAELADRLDDFIEVRLRPMAQVLHPVSVRLGLIPATRSLNPEVTVDAAASVERMDADGALLDDEVRLQLYRWIRAGLPSQGASRVALVVLGRDLQVSLHPAMVTPVDAVQAAAGLRLLGPGLATAPLRGQVAVVAVANTEPTTTSVARPRYRLRDLLTVPLPIKRALVIVLAIGSAPFQFVLYGWSLSAGTLLAALGCALAPIAAAVILDRLPPPKQSVLGAWRVVGEWLVISAASAVAVVGIGTAMAVLPPMANEWGLTLFRMSYRFAVPGLMVTLSYGLVVESHRRLERVKESLRAEEQRRGEILGESRQLDRDVAEALHRTVQGRLAAAVIMLRLGQRDDAWAQVIEMASVEIPWLLERMGDSHADRVLVPDPPMGLTVIQLDDVPLDQQTFGLLKRAVGEIAVNARRHGRASSLVVTIETDHVRCRVVCEDDGSGIQGPVTPGLGSRLLDDTVVAAGGSWRMDPVTSGCRVVLDLPLPVNARGLASSDA
jgi:MFS family permease